MNASQEIGLLPPTLESQPSKSPRSHSLFPEPSAKTALSCQHAAPRNLLIHFVHTHYAPRLMIARASECSFWPSSAAFQSLPLSPPEWSRGACSLHPSDCGRLTTHLAARHLQVHQRLPLIRFSPRPAWVEGPSPRSLSYDIVVARSYQSPVSNSSPACPRAAALLSCLCIVRSASCVIWRVSLAAQSGRC